MSDPEKTLEAKARATVEGALAHKRDEGALDFEYED